MVGKDYCPLYWSWGQLAQAVGVVTLGLVGYGVYRTYCSSKLQHSCDWNEHERIIEPTDELVAKDPEILELEPEASY